MKWLLGVILLAVLGGAYVYMRPAEDTMMDKNQETVSDNMGDDMVDGDVDMMHSGYEAYAPEKLAYAKTGKVVLFFRASWCPTCHALDADLKESLKDLPKDLTILDVNYDTETALKQKYGVTSQHTLVQVDAAGNQITKWSGGLTLETVLAQVK